MSLRLSFAFSFLEVESDSLSMSRRCASSIVMIQLHLFEDLLVCLLNENEHNPHETRST